MLLLCSTNTRSFVHDKSSFTKLSDLQNLLRFVSGIVTSTFNVGIGGRAGQSASPLFLSCAGLTSVFPVILSYT